MSVRRDTTNRFTLFRTCGTCGKRIVTTADTPWIRQLARDGKKQATTYFCSEKCFAASYKNIGWYDGKAEERRRLKDRNVDPVKKSERRRRYYAAHAEEEKEKARLRRLANPGAAAADSAYHRKKRKLLAGGKEGTTNHAQTIHQAENGRGPEPQ